MTELSKRNLWISWTLLFFLSLTWGSSYILIKRGLVAFDPLQVASIRLTVASLTFLPIFLFIQKSVDWSKWKYLLITGLTGNAIPAFLFAVAQTNLSSSMTGVLNSLTPLFTLLLAVIVFKTPFKKNTAIGVFVGFLGAFLLAWFGKESGASTNAWYTFFVVGGGMCYAVSSNTVASKLQGSSSMVISAASFLMLLPVALMLFFYSDVTSTLLTHEAGWTSLGFICVLAIFGTVIASILYYQLVHLTGAVVSSFVSYLVPIIATGWGFFHVPKLIARLSEFQILTQQRQIFMKPIHTFPQQFYISWKPHI